MSLPRLMLVTDRAVTRGRSLAAVAREVSEALAGEVFVQLREKDLGDEELLALATEVWAALGPGAVMAVNDRAAVARALGVGLHLPAVAMRGADDPRPLGRSVHDADEARVAVGDGVDYAVVGTIFPTASKPGHRGDGLEHLGVMVEALAPIPCYAIGGITRENAADAIAAGAWGVAVRAGILSADQPGLAARAIVDAVRDSLRA